MQYKYSKQFLIKTIRKLLSKHLGSPKSLPNPPCQLLIEILALVSRSETLYLHIRLFGINYKNVLKATENKIVSSPRTRSKQMDYTPPASGSP